MKARKKNKLIIVILYCPRIPYIYNIIYCPQNACLSFITVKHMKKLFNQAIAMPSAFFLHLYCQRFPYMVIFVKMFLNFSMKDWTALKMMCEIIFHWRTFLVVFIIDIVTYRQNYYCFIEFIKTWHVIRIW